ncbi:uncharacterized protein LOC130966830 [Arachis stenosperma]|uniref:uncharacterized protein LOC130966830 n=1 Tax=Arachis stenosperma TaxID=217475 RepID=UPI0025ACAC76|nr:uncharacterized protein LOC130966830 [Arachis stenosperma]
MDIFGKPKAIVYIVEFQKRGLPYCYILFFIQPNEKPRSSDDIDHHISTEIPNEHLQPKIHRLVQKFMVHGPCGVINRSSSCMVNEKCSKFYPMVFHEKTAIDSAGFPKYKCSDNGHTTSKKNVNIDNWFIVPYNVTLLLKYGCHINVEYTFQTSAIKYLFKYVHKGNDCITTSFFLSHGSDDSAVTVNEIQNYYDCRYIYACEASWRLFGFEIQFKKPNVIRLPFHLPNEQNVLYEDHQLIENVIETAISKDSMLIGWLKANKDFDAARTLNYAEMPLCFVWDKQGHIWKPFKEACYALGLLQDDRKFIDAINEASSWASPNYIRRLFAMLLMSNNMVRPDIVWEQCWQHCADDTMFDRRHNLGEHYGEVVCDVNLFYYGFKFRAFTDEIKSTTLAKIEKLLQLNGRTLKEFIDLPFSNLVDSIESPDTVYFDELNFNKIELASISIDLFSFLNRDQRVAYDTIFNAVSHGIGGFLFVYGCGGTGKTFLWNALSASIRSKGHIVLNVPSSGIAALLLPNGQTTHSRFKVPLSVNQDSILLDKCLKDVLRFDHGYNPNAPFGEKFVVLGGDFCQILPVIPRGSREEIVHACDELFGDSTDGESVIRIQDNLLLDIESLGLHDLVLFVYPDILLRTSSVDYFKDMSILAPTLDVVTEVNNHVMSLIPGNEKVYLGSNTLLNEDGHLESELYTMSTELVLKIDVPVMLLRNIDQSNGLCNDTRMQVRRFGDHVIECVILAGRNIGEVAFIPG